MRHHPTIGLLTGAALSLAGTAHAGDINADPSTFQDALGALQPGDTLHLAAGTYPHLTVNNRNGTAATPIVIEGAAAGATVIGGDGDHNTVEIIQSSYVVVRGLTVDSKGLDGVFGVSAKDGPGNVVHHVTVEGCHFIGQNAGQQTVAISTKTPTWGWVIRGNVIDGAGTGFYLGNSNGDFPFVAGLIEGNIIRNTIGYNGQIKFQNPWPDGLGLPTGPNRTIIRNNVFLKNDQESPDGDRPNLLIGGSPTTGPGSSDLYEIYGNFFFHNPREALLQVAGRVTIHDNVFVDSKSPAIVAQNHDVPLALAHVYNNTIYTQNTGIHVGAATESSSVVGNLVLAGVPIDGSPGTTKDNLVDSFASAASYVKAPSYTLGSMDFYPLDGKVTGAPLDLSAFAADTDHGIDFNGTSKGTFTFRGAYSGSGTNPGWKPVDGPKDGGSTGGTGGAGGSSGGGAGAGGANAAGSTSNPAGAGPGGSSTAAGAGPGGSGGAGTSPAGGSSGSGGSAGAASGGKGGSPAGSAGSAGTAGSSGDSNDAATPDDSSGCGCRVVPDNQPSWGSVLLGLGWAARRIRSSRRRRG